MKRNLDRYRDAARIYNSLIWRVYGSDEEGVVRALTPAGGIAAGLGAPVELQDCHDKRILMGNNVEASSKAAAFINTWAGWIEQEGGASSRPATSLFEQAVQPFLGMSASGGLVKAWTPFGGAVFAMERQLSLIGDCVPAVRVLREFARALELGGDDDES